MMIRTKNTLTPKISAHLTVSGLILFLLAAFFQIASRSFAGFAEWYASNMYPWIVGIYGRFFGIFPFSVAEISIYLLILLIIFDIVFHFRQWRAIASRIFFLTGWLFFLYTMNCGINYYRNPFSSYAGLEVRDSSVDELKELCVYLTERINDMETERGLNHDAVLAETAGNGTLTWKQQLRLGRQGQNAMKHLGTLYPQLSGFYPAPKPVLVSWILAVQQLSGIYSPFTIEANYNRNMTAYNIPHTICHELSHLRGFMREDEANFIGYLACICSKDQEFQYSGYLTGWIYAGNALAAQDPDSYIEIYKHLPPQALTDLQSNNEYWNRYEGKVAEAANQMNDTYLKLNDQTDGVKSYGRVVDLMLAYRRKEIGY